MGENKRFFQNSKRQKMTFSLSASNPLFPSLMPRLVDPLWFKVDAPQDENAELTKLEKEHSDWLKSIGERDTALLPIGKTSPETDEDSEDDDDNDDDDNDESSHDEDDDAEMDLGGERTERTERSTETD